MLHVYNLMFSTVCFARSANAIISFRKRDSIYIKEREKLVSIKMPI